MSIDVYERTDLFEAWLTMNPDSKNPENSSNLPKQKMFWIHGHIQVTYYRNLRINTLLVFPPNGQDLVSYYHTLLAELSEVQTECGTNEPNDSSSGIITNFHSVHRPGNVRSDPG